MGLTFPLRSFCCGRLRDAQIRNCASPLCLRLQAPRFTFIGAPHADDRVAQCHFWRNDSSAAGGGPDSHLRSGV